MYIYLSIPNHAGAVYAGFDPTAPSLHLGNLVTLCNLLRFAKGGHRAIALLGGATGLIGDPSWRHTAKQQLANEKLAYNLESISTQIRGFFQLHGQEVLVVNNADWYEPMQLLTFLQTVGHKVRINDMVGRDSVQSRLESGLSYAEFTYQLLQAYDFWHLHRTHGCALQIGGSDQRGNMVAGIELIHRMDPGAQVAILTTPLLTVAGGQKMGKSAGNAIWLDKNLTSILDLYQYLLGLSDEDVKELLPRFTFTDVSGSQHNLAFEVCSLVHGQEAAQAAARLAHSLHNGIVNLSDACICLHQAKPENWRLLDVLHTLWPEQSRNQLRHACITGAITVNCQTIMDPSLQLPAETAIIGMGKRHYKLVLR